MENERVIVKNEIKTWHPEKWSEFIGKENHRPDERLRQSVLNHRLPVRSLFISPYDGGKTVRAEHFIKSFRCPNATADANPCHVCDECTRQGREYNGDGTVYQQYQFDCHRILTRAELLPLLAEIESADKPAVFFDQLEGLQEGALRLLPTFLDKFQGIFIAAITAADLQGLTGAARTAPALAPVYERLRKVYFRIPEADEMVAFFKSKTPEWGVTADEAMLQLMVMASQRSFRTCLEILQAAHENDPPVLDRATIEEFLTIDDNAISDDDALGLNDDDDDDDAPE